MHNRFIAAALAALVAASLAAAVVAPARADQKISAMPGATLPLVGDELLPIVQFGANRSVAASNLVSRATAADVKAGASPWALITPQAESAALSRQTLLDGATIAWDAALGRNARVTLTASGHAIAAPTHVIEGQTYVLWLVQDATGSRTVSWDAAFKFGTFGTPTLTTTPNKADMVTCVAYDGTPTLHCTFARGF